MSICVECAASMDAAEASGSLICTACRRQLGERADGDAPWYVVRSGIDDRLDRPQLAPHAWGGRAELPFPGDADEVEARYHRYSVRLARR